MNDYEETYEIDERSFGKFIREKREALGETVRGFAAKLEITPAYLVDIEKGNRYAPKKYFDKIIKELKLSEDEKDKFYDMAAVTRGYTYEDINPYLGQQPIARVALRRARDLNIPEEEWYSFIEQMDKYCEDTNLGNTGLD